MARLSKVAKTVLSLSVPLVWWIAALDNVTGSLKVAAVLLTAYAAWQISGHKVPTFRLPANLIHWNRK